VHPYSRTKSLVLFGRETWTLSPEEEGCFVSKCCEQQLFFKFHYVIINDQETGDAAAELNTSSAAVC
jgi:hypothetical protein